MNVLGISDSHDSGVVVYQDGILRYAANEERFIRKKCYWGFPKLALEDACKMLGLSLNDFDLIGVSPITHFVGHEYTDFDNRNKMSFAEKLYGYAGGMAPWFVRSSIGETLIDMFGGFNRWMTGRSWLQNIRRAGLTAPVRVYRHHLSHAAGAYFTNSSNPAISITLDCSGDGLSGSIYYCKDCSMNRIASCSSFDSLGFFIFSSHIFVDSTPHATAERSQGWRHMAMAGASMRR